MAADRLTSAWEQNGGGYVASPALSVAEEVAAGWVRDSLGLPAGCGAGFGWQTTADDVNRSAEAILAAARAS